MTPQEMARLHAAAFTQERPWSAQEFESLLSSPHVATISAPEGFALARSVAGESELLTVAVDPQHQRQGIGRALVQKWLKAAAATCESAFLEVASDNLAARSLYQSLGFEEVGLRTAYYTRKNGASPDAILMRIALAEV